MMRAMPWVMAALTVLTASSLPAQETPPAPLAAEPVPAPSPTPTPAPAAARPPFVAGYKNGFTLPSETGDFVLRVTGYFQADARFAPSDDANLVTNQFVMRRARPLVVATVAKYFDLYF